MSQSTTLTPLLPNLEGVQAYDQFVFEQAALLALQMYLEAGRKLPTSEIELSTDLQLSQQELSKLKSIVPVYRKIAEHCSHFKMEIYQQLMDGAGDISSYSQNATPLYGMIHQVVDLYTQASADEKEQLRAEFHQEVEMLHNQVRTNGIRVEGVKHTIERFIEQFASDTQSLEQARARYQEMQSAQNAEQQSYQARIAKIRTQIEQLNQDYEHNYYKAHKEPAMYGWLGLVGAGIAIGMSEKHTQIYRAIEKEINELKQQIASAPPQVYSIARFLTLLTQATGDVQRIQSTLQTVLDVIQKVKDLWANVENDLDELLQVTNLEQLPGRFSPAAVADAITLWQTLGEKANNYRAISFVLVSEDQISTEIERLR